MNWINLGQQLSTVRVAGNDARSFLHAQLTCDVNRLTSDQGCLGACLTAQGKVVASFYVLPDEADWLLLCATDRASAVVAHLSRYILRAKVTMVADPQLQIRGALPSAALPNAGNSINLSLLERASDGHWSLPDGRILGAGAATGDSDDWTRFDWRQGLVIAAEPICDRFIPQMLNLDQVGAVSFIKGCYPGQEIVARARNLGRVKRGLGWLAAATPVAAGDKLLDADGGSCGEIITSLPLADDRCEALAVMRLDSPEQAWVNEQPVAPVLFHR